MGNGVSRAASLGPKGSMKANPLAPTPEPTQNKESYSRTSTLKMTPPSTYQPLTPPPSGDSKQQDSSNEITHVRPASPPASPDPRRSTLSPTLLDTPTPNTSFSTPSSSFSFSHPKHSLPSIPCSRCHRRISHPQPSSQRSKPQAPSPPAQCGHALCHRCLRAALITSLSTDPFTPAGCPVQISPPQPTITNPNPTSTPPPTTTTTTCKAPLPLPTLGAIATPAEFLAYRNKLREMRTPPDRRLYCHDREGCGMFLGVQSVIGTGMEGVVEGAQEGASQGMGERGVRVRVAAVVCPLCGGRTCSGCGGRAHRFGGGMGSPKDKLGRKRRRTGGLRTDKRRKGRQVHRAGPCCPPGI